MVVKHHLEQYNQGQSFIYNIYIYIYIHEKKIIKKLVKKVTFKF